MFRRKRRPNLPKTFPDSLLNVRYSVPEPKFDRVLPPEPVARVYKLNKRLIKQRLELDEERYRW